MIAPILAVSVGLGIYSTVYSMLETYYIPFALTQVANDKERLAKLISILRGFSTMRLLARDSLWIALSSLLVADAIVFFEVSIPACIIFLASVAPIFISVYSFHTVNPSGVV